MTPDASLNDNVPPPYRGLDRGAARVKVVADLEALGLVDRVEPHKLMVPRGDRSNAVLEPLLTDQWFVDIKPLATPAIEAVESGRIRFIPDNWSGVYFEWMRHIKDWCISRQLWWGHRIPAWYDEEGRWYVAHSEAEARAAHGLDASVALRQDEDVLDTWFSSALWPFSTQGWPHETRTLETYYPTSVLVTGFDIIFFWVARMIMMGLKFTGEVPFREVYVHGLIRDHDGQKMSKSKGNVIDPLDIVDGIALDELIAKRTTGLMQPQMKPAIEKATRKQFPHGIPAYGTDALRLTFASLATQSRDLRFDMAKVEGNRNFCNKLWNAARYVLMNVEGGESPEHGAAISADAHALSLADRWIRSRLAAMLARVEAGFADYRLDIVANALYEFTWNEFCDWYVELSKAVLQSDTASEAEKRATRATLIGTLEVLLRALHPLAPFITEEIWQRVRAAAGVSGETIMLCEYPAAQGVQTDAAAEPEMRWVMGFILGVRQIHGEMDIPLSRRVRRAAAERGKHRCRVSRPQPRLSHASRGRRGLEGTRARGGRADLRGRALGKARDPGPDGRAHRSQGRARAARQAAPARGNRVRQAAVKARERRIREERSGGSRGQGPGAPLRAEHRDRSADAASRARQRAAARSR